jgi:hypothetical protein
MKMNIPAASDCIDLIARKLADFILMLGSHGTLPLLDRDDHSPRSVDDGTVPHFKMMRCYPRNRLKSNAGKFDKPSSASHHKREPEEGEAPDSLIGVSLKPRAAPQSPK